MNRFLTRLDRGRRNGSWRSLWWLPAAVLLCSLLVVQPESKAATTPPGGGLTAFTPAESPARVYLVSAEGGTPQLWGTGMFPDWTPNAARMAYDGRPNLFTDFGTVYVANGDGSDAKIVNQDARLPTISADGKEVAFETPPTSFCPQNFTCTRDFVEVAKSDGTELAAWPGQQPAWSPTGDQIAYVTDTDANWNPVTPGIYVSNADGSDQHLVAAFPAKPGGGNEAGGYPRWSPDGSQIAFDRSVTTQTGRCANVCDDIFEVDASGGNAVDLTANRSITTNEYPDWSPDGTMIDFYSFDTAQSPASGLYVMSADGTNQQQVIGDYSPSGASPGPVMVGVRWPAPIPKPPTADFTSTALDSPPTQYKFVATATDPAGGGLTYKWDFGDGETGTGSTVTHTYTASGYQVYYPSLTVTDVNGGQATVNGMVEVGKPPPPVAEFSAQTDPTSPNYPLTMDFDASASQPSPEAGYIADYSWDFGDTTTGDTASPTTSHDYPYPCVYPVKLTVTDDQGNVADTTQKVTVGDAPQAKFTSGVSDSNPLEAIFDASESTNALDYSWDYGDGQTGTGMISPHVYAKAGTYDVTLTVGDANGCDVKASGKVTVGQPNLSVSDTTVTEPASGTTNAEFKVTLDQASTDTVTVDYATKDGTATVAHGDYEQTSGPLTFTPGQTSKTVDVPVDASGLTSGNFYLDLSAASGAKILKGEGTATITGKFAITTTSLPDGGVGQTYSQTLAATGGTTPYTWVVKSGSLPDGLDLSLIAGTISGTPTKAGTFTFTVQATDSSNPAQNATAQLTLKVADVTFTARRAEVDGLENVTVGESLSYSGQGWNPKGGPIKILWNGKVVKTEDAAATFSGQFNAPDFPPYTGLSKAQGQQPCEATLTAQQGSVERKLKATGTPSEYVFLAHGVHYENGDPVVAQAVLCRGELLYSSDNQPIVFDPSIGCGVPAGTALVTADLGGGRPASTTDRTHPQDYGGFWVQRATASGECIDVYGVFTNELWLDGQLVASAPGESTPDGQLTASHPPFVHYGPVELRPGNLVSILASRVVLYPSGGPPANDSDGDGIANPIDGRPGGSSQNGNRSFSSGSSHGVSNAISSGSSGQNRAWHSSHSFVDESNTFSSSFTDVQLGGSTTGSISDRNGVTVDVTPANGQIEIGGAVAAQPLDGSAGSASVNECGFVLRISGGNDALTRCGPFHVQALSGPIEIDLGSGKTVSVPTGATATLERNGSGGVTISNDPGSSLALTVTGGGSTVSISPGDSLTVTGVNGPPVCSPVHLTAVAGQVASVRPQCSSPGGDPLTYDIVSVGTKGTAWVEDGELHYSPTPDQQGADSFTYEARDSDGVSGVAAVQVEIARSGGRATLCGGLLPAGTYGNVIVPAWATCTLGPDVHVTHDLWVGRGATLLSRATVGHDLLAAGPAGIGIYWGASIGHDLVIEGATGSTLPNNDNYICDTSIGHDLIVWSSAAGAGPWYIGAGPECTYSNTVGHDMYVHDNHDATYVSGNQVGHDAICSANDPETVASGNEAGHILVCPAPRRRRG